MDRNITNRPIFFKRNRVFREYLGGKNYNRLFGDEAIDSNFPEEWVASYVKAINPQYFGSRDGVSVIQDTDIYFDDLLNNCKAQLLGDNKYDFLVKYIDSSIRLSAQVHPTPTFSQQHLHSTYGKTESWLVVDASADAKLYIGLKEPIDIATLDKIERNSLHDKDAMCQIMQEVTPSVGDVYLIRGGLLHAIGQGCTIIEIQEPTDFTIKLENWSGNYRIAENTKYLGLDREVALSCVDCHMFGSKAINQAKITPSTVVDTPSYTKELLVTYQHTTCFATNRHTLHNGSFVMDNAPSVYIVLQGKGAIVGDNYYKEICVGDYYFIPYLAKNNFYVEGDITLLECLPSKH